MDDEQNNGLIVVDQLREMPTEPDKVPIDQQAKNLIVEGVKSVPVFGNVVSAMAAQVLKVGEYSPEQRLRNLQFDWLVEVLPPILKRIERLIDEGVQVESPDIGAIFEAALDASRKTTGKKREYLKKALENAFSLKMYEEGQVLRFFSILAELEYGDIFTLEWYVIERPLELMIATKHDRYARSRREEDLHLDFLHERDGTLPVNPILPDSMWDNLDFHCLNLVRVGLIYKYQEWQWHIRNIAKEFIWFVTADDEDLEDDTAE